MSEERLKYLFERHLTKICTPAEKEELAALALEAGNDAVVKQLVSQSWERTGTDEDMAEENAKRIMEAILHGLPEEIPFQTDKVRWISWRRIAVAASIILILGVGTYLAIVGGFSNKKKTDIVKTQQERFKNDVAAPHINKATLTLEDGTVIVLDSMKNGSLATQGTAKVSKVNDGQIIYKTDATITAEVKYNTLSVPRGSKPVQLFLADGSEVWLDAATTIIYPTSFVGNERNIEMKGQAYFEVTKNTAMPFNVRKTGDDLQIKVFGTHFNVNAFEDEPMKITLLEGSIQVKKGSNQQMLSPGQQVQVNSNGEIKLAKTVDVDEVMAWKNGLFRFKGSDIESIMQQVARWYDVDVEYKGNPPNYPFVAKIPRDMPVSELLKLLELTELVHFTIEGKKITVMP